MIGGIYDILLNMGILCSFIKGMTNTWLLHNLVIPTFKEILQKSSQENYALAGIIGRELLASRPIFSHPGMHIQRPRDPCNGDTSENNIQIGGILQWK